MGFTPHHAPPEGRLAAVARKASNRKNKDLDTNERTNATSMCLLRIRASLSMVGCFDVNRGYQAGISRCRLLTRAVQKIKPALPPCEFDRFAEFFAARFKRFFL